MARNIHEDDSQPMRPMTEDERYAIQVSVDAVVKTELERQELSRRKRLIEIQEAFGYERDLMPLARMINPDAEDDRQIKRFLSRRGMRNAEYETVKARFDDFLVISRKLKQAYPGRQAFAQRREVLSKINGQILTETGVNAFETDTNLLVDAVERTVGFLSSEHPMR
jgi:hypothetical protein